MRDFAIGARYLARGFGFWGKRPRVMMLGMVPALLASVLLIAALIALGFNVYGLAGWLTPFANGWDDTLREVIQVGAAVLLFAFGLWMSILLFTALTLLIGDPFYEKISEQVEQELGGAPELGPGLWASIGRALGDAVRVFFKSLLISIGLFVIGLVPVIGSAVSLVLGALVGGWFLAVELTGHAFGRRGMRYTEYREILAHRRGLALGFGTPVFLLFLIPLAVIVVMPAAVAGATMLARGVVNGPTPHPGSPTSSAYI